MSETYISISQFSNYIKNIFDAEIMLHHIFLYGEVSSYNVSNNIAYFTLKDDEALLNCVMFGASNFERPSIGDRVLVNGSPNYYVKGGRFSFQVTHIEPYGKGKLYEQFLQLKAELEQLGYFDEKNKKTIPTKVKRIGVVTSKEGAVIQDIINVTTRRNSTIDIVLYPVKVQGIGAEQEIAQGINYFSNYGGVDCVVVARGGGNAEDLQAYNTREVATAVHYCSLPIISAVGHETDFSICDFCSDLRVPTPSAAAEVLAWDYYETVAKIETYHTMCQNSVIRKITDCEEDLQSDFAKITSRIKYDVDRCVSVIDSNWKVLSAKLENKIIKIEQSLNGKIQQINSKNPVDLLAKGYVKLIKNGQVIKQKSELNTGDLLQTTFIDGKIELKVNRKE